MKVALLSRSKPQSLATFLLHLDYEVDFYSDLISFFAHYKSKPSKVLFVDEGFLLSEDDYRQFRVYLDRLSVQPKSFVLSEASKIFKLKSHGVVHPEDFNLVKTLLQEVQTPLIDSDLDAHTNGEEVVVEIEEEVVDEQANRFTEAVLKVRQAQSLDQVGVALSFGLGTVLKSDRKGLFFKYLPTYCSLVALDGFHLPTKSVSGIGLNFSNSQAFKPEVHLLGLSRIAAFSKISKKLLGTEVVKVRLIQVAGEVVAAVVANQAASGQTDHQFDWLCDYAEMKLLELHYKTAYSNNKTKDELTGALLKEGFFDSLQNEIARAKRVLLPVTVMVFELDHFHGIKAKFNAERVRQILKVFAKLLKSNIRHNDILGRLSENRFALLFPHMGQKDAVVKAKSLQKQVQQTKFLSDMKATLQCSVSLALGTYPNHISSADEFIVSLETQLSYKESIGSLAVLSAPVGFIKDFEERALPPSALNNFRQKKES